MIGTLLGQTDLTGSLTAESQRRLSPLSRSCSVELLAMARKRVGGYHSIKLRGVLPKDNVW